MKAIILLVEDEVKTAQMLSQALESEEFCVEWVTNGDAALGTLEKGKFDLIILDLKLPGMAGDEVLERLRKIDPYVEVIVYTNYQEPPVMKKLINLGIHGYINKGASADLWDTVERVKKMLDPFTADERHAVLRSSPEGIFSAADLKSKA